MITKRTKTSTLVEVMSTLQGPGWSWLPRDILDLILERIEIKDWIMFGLVCKHWRSVALNQNKQQLGSCPKLPPLRMLINRLDDGTRSVALRGATLDQTARFHLKLKDFPIYDMSKDCGSYQGWLAYANYANSVVTLLNPFTGHTITLPPLCTDEEHYLIRIDKVVLSADPSLCLADFEALVMYSHYAFAEGTKLAHFKSGPDAWTRIDNDYSMTLSYAKYYKGKYLVCHYNCASVLSVDVSSKRTDIHVYLPDEKDSKTYLAESSEGDLLLVRKLSSSKNPIKVFKLLGDFDGRFKRVQIKNIGYGALFLDRNQCFCVSALEFPECHPNSIYFVDGTFNLENQKTA